MSLLVENPLSIDDCSCESMRIVFVNVHISLRFSIEPMPFSYVNLSSLSFFGSYDLQASASLSFYSFNHTLYCCSRMSHLLAANNLFSRN